MRFRFIHAEKANHRIVTLCRVMDVSTSGYYAWAKRGESKRKKEERALSAHIRRVHAESGRTYGSPRVHRALRLEGIVSSRNRVARVMRRLAIVARHRRRFVVTTQSDHDHGFAADLVRRNFKPKAANMLWATDITYLWTKEGWLYLAVVMDLFSRRVVGWAMGDRIDCELVLRALDMALLQRRPCAGLVHHSDRGSQYACPDYQRALTARGIKPSMSRKGNCWDNAVVESFFSSLKAESDADTGLPTRNDARMVVLSWLAFYNRRRLHSSLDYVSPNDFEYYAVKMALAS